MARVQKQTIAKALGISAGLVSRYAKLGMPVTDVESARRWKQANIAPRIRTAAAPRPSNRVHVTGTGGGAGWTPDVAKHAIDLIATFARNATQDFAVWAQPLREAMRQLPPVYWDQVVLPVEVWNDLIGDRAVSVLEASENDLTEQDRARPIPPEHRFIVQNWPYMLACGLVGLDE